MSKYKTLSDIKNEYASEIHAFTWISKLDQRDPFGDIVERCDIIAKRYAQEKVKEALEKAAENAELTGVNDWYETLKESILETEVKFY